MAFLLHKAGVYRILESVRDYSQFLLSYKRKSFSQFGEDLFIRDYFGDRTGVYIDIGGNHPFRISNTYLLYRMGWSGIVVEPIQRFYAKHKQFRPRDTQLNAAASDTPGDLTFYEMVPSVLSTCSAEEAESMTSNNSALLLRSYTVPVMTVDDLYRKYVAPRPVSLLSVDTEGHDLAVLRGIDWKIMHPDMIICEAINSAAGHKISELLTEQRYKCIKSLGCNNIYVPC
jgi:FkbM family methyltransferase